MMKDTGENISNALGIANEVMTIEHVELPATVEHTPVDEKYELPPDASEDYKEVRKTLKIIIKKGTESFDEISSLARQLESPRGYEVLATMMKTVADTTKDLFDLQKKTKELKGADKINENPPVNIDKAVFVGTTAELLRKVKYDREVDGDSEE
jgi:Terminase DNA packaging enzyme